MGIFTGLFDRLSKKANPFDEYFVKLLANQALYPSETNQTYLDSYLGNNDVFTIINKITEPASTVPVFQYDQNGDIVEKGKMLALLNNPNPYYSRSQFIEAALSFYYIFGEEFTVYETLEGGMNAGIPLRLDHLPPKWMKVNLGTIYNPVAGYSFYPLNSDKSIDYSKEKVFHWKEFNPDYDYNGGHLRGMSRLRPLLRSVIGSTEAYNSLVKAFQNQGAWGLLAILDQEGKAVDLNKEQRSIVKAKFKADAKKGDLSVISNKADWTKIGLTVVELEILRSLGVYKGNICDAYNVPSQLLSGSQDRTYNNYKEAEASLWRNAIQPSLDAYLEGLSNWLAPLFREEGTVLKADYSNVACLQTNHVELAQWMTTARSFTKNEIREALGYERLELPGMDIIHESAGQVPLDELGEAPSVDKTEENLKNIPDYRQ